MDLTFDQFIAIAKEKSNGCMCKYFEPPYRCGVMRFVATCEANINHCEMEEWLPYIDTNLDGDLKRKDG